MALLSWLQAQRGFDRGEEKTPPFVLVGNGAGRKFPNLCHEKKGEAASLDFEICSPPKSAQVH